MLRRANLRRIGRLFAPYKLRLSSVLVLIVVSAGLAYWMRVRLFVASERGLAQLRVDAFRHVHDLSMLTQNAERRGVLVSRVTSDIDQVSQFLQFTGIMIVVSLGQILVATIIMAWYSWQLTLVVWICFLPLGISLKFFADRLSRAYDTVRRTVGEMLAVIAEPVVRAYAIERRTQRRVDEGIDRNLHANTRAQRLVAVTFASASAVSGMATQRARLRQWSTFSVSVMTPMSATPSNALEIAAPLVAAVLNPARSTRRTL